MFLPWAKWHHYGYLCWRLNDNSRCKTEWTDRHMQNMGNQITEWTKRRRLSQSKSAHVTFTSRPDESQGLMNREKFPNVIKSGIWNSTLNTETCLWKWVVALSLVLKLSCCYTRGLQNSIPTIMENETNIH